MKQDKFNFLMLLTQSDNEAFAGAVSRDVSEIKALRTGKTRLPDSPGFISKASDYFADRISVLNKQSTAASIILEIGSWPDDIMLASRIIDGWLHSETDQLSDHIYSFLAAQSAKRTDIAENDPSPASVPADVSANSVRTFLGNEGKRRGLLLAFEMMCADPKPYDLMAYSDEPLSWFTEDKSFFDQWKSYCLKLIDAGSTITIVNFLKRNEEEMQEGLRMWLPIALTGALRTYYCERLSDTVYDRTLFVARGKVAFTCNSLRLHDYHAVNTLFSDTQTVNSFTKEFESYLSICRPLTLPYSGSKKKELKLIYKDFMNSVDNLVCAGPVPSLVEPTGGMNTVTDIILLPRKEEVLIGRVPVLLRTLNTADRQFYKPGEYVELLEQALAIASRNKKYSLIASNGAGLPEHVFLLFKPKTGILFGVNFPDEMTLHCEQPSVLTVFQSFLSRFISFSNIRALNELKIRKYIADIRKNL